MTTYFGILTKIGEAKEANAKALGIPVQISELEVGDGGGTLPTPDREQTALIGLKRRAQINRSFVDPGNPNWLVIEQIIPEQVGGWWIRELGLRDADGDLVAVANCPPTYKPQLSEGSSRTQVVRMVLLVTSSNNFTLKIDPSVVLATRGYVDEEAAKKLGKTETAVAAKKLQTGRKLSISGAAKASAKTFNGEDDVDLVLSELDMDKASKGTLAVAHGGTGLTSISKNEILVGTQQGEFIRMSADQLRALMNAPKVFSINDLPTANIGPIIVAECAEVWIWSASDAFIGYRHPLCGRPVDGHTLTPLASEVDAVGGLLPKAEYARLWGYARENGLVVSQATWTANQGAHYFVDVDVNYFRVPDLRNMFRRFTGTDVDTGNARTLGSRQQDALQRITGSMQLRPDDTGGAMILNSPNGAFDVTPSGGSPGAARMVSNASPLVQNLVTFDSSRAVRSSAETRGPSAAFYPRMHT